MNRRSSSETVFDALRDLIEHRDLLYIMAWREIKMKYKQSVMGMLWAVLMPLIIVCAGILVRFAFSSVSGTRISISDLASVAVKATPWAFFVSVLRFGTNSLIANTNLVTKVYLPRLVFPIAAVLSQLADFLVASFVVAVIVVIAGTGVSVELLWLPVLISILVILAAALAIIFSAASLFFRDVKYIVEVLLTFAIFFTPVFYDSSIFGRWAPLLLINPVSPLLESVATTTIFHRSPSLPWFLYSTAVTGILFMAALVIFKKLEPFFAENV